MITTNALTNFLHDIKASFGCNTFEKRNIKSPFIEFPELKGTMYCFPSQHLSFIFARREFFFNQIIDDWSHPGFLSSIVFIDVPSIDEYKKLTTGHRGWTSTLETILANLSSSTFASHGT